MTPPPPLFHALLRPAVLQILRATGYHAAKTCVIDSVTDLAARYFLHICHLTAVFATHNNEGLPPSPSPSPSPPLAPSSSSPGVPPPASTSVTDAPPVTTTTTTTTTAATLVNPAVPAPTIVDVRMALQRAGALLPERIAEEQEYVGEEDTRGVDNFIAWAMGPLNREIARIALDGNDEAGDYLDALKKKHSKNDDDSKFLGTLLGRSIEHGDVLVEGGEWPSILAWEERRRLASEKTPEPPQRPQQNRHGDVNGDGDGEESRPPSSGLSSLGDRSIADEMDLS
ncbi:hypothetical protein MYCTH_2296260 [Thermothelomyces thermophilus ATCC 42464]|uniref:Bromodomain associated domain-containing protein n=1 Tax=Thermothelomyces thermophilus (strain ATCC 42464 / BCRC 31852 / DSM 1799) TaxID=573729 RepID=G2Q108_THET4|nr:uncharacterized protein MYCTH_2296260 [Thermothelomyces thermophilus ATCC 42464]AEO54106.1 hypothetical protein MYCTH_2296260 [Thermothelomyces thermophilus ATCC 42464]